MPLHIHPADDDERLVAYRNVHEMWGRGQSLEQYVAERLRSPQHRRAEWFVGTQGGRVITSLGGYPLEFRVGDAVIPGFAIGAVHSLPEFRGQGFAQELLRGVEREFVARGGKLSLLYSDIAPEFYERLGYAVFPGSRARIPRSAAGEWDSVIEVQTTDVPTADELSRNYFEAHRTRRFVIHRSHSYCEYLLQKADFEGLHVRRLLDRESADVVGHIVYRITASELEWLDVAAKDMNIPVLKKCIAALAANVPEAETLTGWVPDEFSLEAPGQVHPRSEEITMVKPLVAEIDSLTTMAAETGWFQGLDHV